ncbi:hypothetical protein EKO04_007901 [Ascochyta lentis]|uniref:MFS general substrate transporter n=1 Tax=Ascochyta lentis TaxID=205686 RepID=A0A8H7MFD9_9PLEO|nr:hypothetical protein EKO04_007901 [Ascochyta lentis]
MAPARDFETLPWKEPLSMDGSQFTSEHSHSRMILKTAHRKVDKRLLCWYAFVLLFMRTNMVKISNTAIMNLEKGSGIKKELGDLSSSEWAWALSIFYYPYMVFERVATLALKHFNPNVWMSRIMITWGIISMCQVATQNYAGILACRFFLGAAEAGFYPGVLFHMSFWYSTDHLPLRIDFLYSCGIFSGTVSGLLAYAISFMHGVVRVDGWRWLLILEGIPDILFSVYTWSSIVADLPRQAPTMHAKTFDVDQIRELFRSKTFVTFLMIWITHGIGGWGISFVLPTVIYQLGISNTAISQIMTIPPFALVFVILCSLAWFIHTKRLSPWVAGLGVEIAQIVCYILLIIVNQPVAKYFFVMIATAASQSFFAIIWPERIRAARGTTRAGLAIGITNASCQLMGIVGPQIYQPKFGPTYRVSYISSIALLAACVCAVLTSWSFVVKSDKRQELEELEG